MRLRGRKTKNSRINITAAEVVAGDNTIINALEKVLIESRGCALDEEKLLEAKDAFNFLEERLQFSPIQSIVVAMLVDNDGPLGTKNMAHYLDTRNIQIITHMAEIVDLIQRRIVRKVREMDEDIKYIVVPAAVQSYMKNEVYVAPNDENLTLVEFFERVDDFISQRSDRIMDVKELHGELSNLIQKNKNLELCKCIAEYTLDCQILFLYCCNEYVNNGDINIHWGQYQEFYERNSWGSVSLSISSGDNPLLQNGLIEYHSKEGLVGNTNAISVASDIRKRLSEKLGLVWDESDSLEHCVGLLKHEDISDKHLYYNSREREAIDKLRKILQQEQFESIQHRLSESGMRKGFACIFFGAPGTGKTETALQLAKATGRDIMQVNITDIRSKWVGESEKNIKDIFVRYRKLCHKSGKQPILLFNEADAVFGTRMENISRSVDKMENAMQNIILEEMEKLDGILIATTNLTCNMDKAFERRFLYKVEFTRPNTEARQSIWRSIIPELSQDDVCCLAKEYDLSGGQIENIARKRLVDYILYDKSSTLDALRKYCDNELMEHMQTRKPVVGFR
ncbi:MAG: ATP-binding protein [Bacteroidaceae bacterium]|nr:ATP-binding protein [Bacteroidaceae bacterium]